MVAKEAFYSRAKSLRGWFFEESFFGFEENEIRLESVLEQGY